MISGPGNYSIGGVSLWTFIAELSLNALKYSSPLKALCPITNRVPSTRTPIRRTVAFLFWNEIKTLSLKNVAIYSIITYPPPVFIKT